MSLVWLDLRLNPGLPYHWQTLTLPTKRKAINTFLKIVRPKVHVSARLELKTIYFEAARISLLKRLTNTLNFNIVFQQISIDI